MFRIRMKTTVILISIAMLIITISCLYGMIGEFSFNTDSPKGFKAHTQGAVLNGINFVKNVDEKILKDSGYIGTLVNVKDEGIVDQLDLFTVCADNNILSTQNLSLENIDYSIVEEEAVAFASQAYDIKKIENNCRSVVYVNYRSRNRAKIDLKMTKTLVDGSNGMAPYAGVWDIRSDMIITNINAGLDKHYIKAVAPVIVVSKDMLKISQPITNAQNASISISKSMSSTVQISAGIEYDGRVPNLNVGSSYSFTYGVTKTHTFSQYSFSSTAVSQPEYDLWGNKLEGTKFKSVANDKQYSINHQMVQRVGYYDGDNVPDDLFAFVGIGGLVIDGQGLAPNLTIGNIESSENLNDTNIFGIVTSWKSDNSAHSYMANINGFSNIIMEYSSSNLPLDDWDHSYGYGY